MASTVLTQSPTVMSVEVTEPGTGAVYRITSTVENDPGTTTVCYTLENLSPEGTAGASVSSVEIGLCPGQVCTGESRAFTSGCFDNLPVPIVTDANGVPCAAWPNSGVDCFAYPVALQTPNGQTCGFRIDFDPPLDRGQSRTFCVSFVGEWSTGPAPVRINAEAGAIAEDAAGTVLGLDVLPAQEAPPQPAHQPAAQPGPRPAAQPLPPRGLGWAMTEVEIALP